MVDGLLEQRLDNSWAHFFQEVPVLFSDNFDCQTLDEFVKGTLENDLTDHTIYVHAIEDESYAARSVFFIVLACH